MRKIPLSQGKFATVDDEDYKELNKHKWYALKSHNTFYARRNVSRHGIQRTIKMHRLILNAPSDMQVDHRDGDGLNNRKSNMRLCTNSQNQWNQHGSSGISGYKGVSWHSKGRRWVVRLSNGGKRKYFGSSKCLVKAARIYDSKAKELFGEFACLNFPEDKL